MPGWLHLGPWDSGSLAAEAVRWGHMGAVYFVARWGKRYGRTLWVAPWFPARCRRGC